MPWVFWTVVGVLSFLQGAGFVSDAFLGNKNLRGNTCSAVVLACGLACWGSTILRRSTAALRTRTASLPVRNVP
jgi:dipeptide/tripeptide permease